MSRRASRACAACVQLDTVSCSTSTATTRDPSHAENKLTGERTYFKLQNRVWELEVKIIPEAETEDILTKMQEQSVEELWPFEEQVLWP